MDALSCFRDLEFPLNLYACIQYLEYGNVEHLHYGLFKDDRTTLAEAQHYSTELILQRLPPPPCRILEVGVGMGTTCRELARRGYEVTGLTPNGAQLALARERAGTGVTLVQTKLEDFCVPAQDYQVVLFQESAQYIDILTLFSRAYRLLADGGMLLVLDQVALHYTERHKENPHLLASMLTLADRCGFDLREQLDLSAPAAKTLDHILRLVQNHGASVKETLGLQDHNLDSLCDTNRIWRKKYTDGLYGYALLAFTKRVTGRWRVTGAEREDTPRLLELFRDVFPTEMSPVLWEWKYGEGRGQGVIGWRADKIVAHYGGISRSVLYCGELQLACQICDVMVHPSERGVLTKQGAFFLAAASFLEAWMGFGTRHLLGFGFPDKRVMGLAEKLGLYGEVGRMKAIYWTGLSGKRKPRVRFRELRLEQDQGVLECLWQQMAWDLRDGIVGVRDRSYLQHRYLSHPHKQYELLLLSSRWRNKPFGIVVLGRNGDVGELLDVIAPLDNVPQLVRHVTQLAGYRGMRELFCWVPEYHVHRFAGRGAEIRELDVSIPANVWSNGPGVEQLRNRWWLMSGDTDFH